MYANLKTELRKHKIKEYEVAKELNISLNTLSIKIHKGKFTVHEALKIKKMLDSDLSLEYLFEVSE